MLKKKITRAAALIMTLALCLMAMPAALAASNDLTIDATDVKMTMSDGKEYESVEPGDGIDLIIPLTVKPGIDKTTIKAQLVSDTDLNVFPFIANEKSLAVVSIGAADTQIKFPGLTVSDLATPGNKKIGLKLTWNNGTTPEEKTENFLINISTVEPVPVETPKPSSGSYTASVPKINFDSIEISPNELYPGDAFTLKLVLQNTSTRQSVRNIIVSFSDATATVLPAGTGSNSKFVDIIEKNGGTVEVTFELQIVPSAEARACQLDVKVDYEGGSSSARGPYSTSAGISVPIKQRIRVKCDNPTFYDEVWVGQPVGVQQQMYNLSRATIYNCMVTVEGEGLSIDGDSYFGGNVAAGGTMRADLDLTSQIAGEVKGEIVIRFEDANFEVHEERVPLTLFVNEQSIEPLPATPGNAIPEMPMEGGGTAAGLFGIPWYFLAGGGAVLTAAVILWITAAKKKRARELEEL